VSPHGTHHDVDQLVDEPFRRLHVGIGLVLVVAEAAAQAAHGLELDRRDAGQRGKLGRGVVAVRAVAEEREATPYLRQETASLLIVLALARPSGGHGLERTARATTPEDLGRKPTAEMPDSLMVVTLISSSKLVLDR
jgi:hypothetical protein